MRTPSITLESAAYRSAWSDGTVDLYLGLSLVWIGAAWWWLPDLAGLAPVLPAVGVVPMLAGRQQLVAARLGHVRWRAPRRARERRTVLAMLGVGVLAFLAAWTGYLALAGTSDGRELGAVLAPGLLSWLLALLAAGVAVVIDAWRFLVHAAVLAVGGAVAATLDADPGSPILVAGLVVTAVGARLLRRFLRDHPAVDAP